MGSNGQVRLRKPRVQDELNRLEVPRPLLGRLASIEYCCRLSQILCIPLINQLNKKGFEQ